MLILRGRHTRFELGGSCAAVRTKAIVVLCARDDCTAIPDEKSEDVRSKANVTSPRIALLGAITRLGAAICMPPRVAKDIQFEFSHPQTAALVRRGRRARRAAQHGCRPTGNSRSNAKPSRHCARTARTAR